MAFFPLFDLEWKFGKVITKDTDTKKNRGIFTNAAYLQKQCIFFTCDIMRSVFIFIFCRNITFSTLAAFHFIIILNFFPVRIGIPGYHTRYYHYLEEESGLKELESTCPRT